MTSAPPKASEVEQAAYHWKKGARELFEFAILADTIVGKRNGETVTLARKIRRSPATIETYAKGGKLWLAMLEKYPSDSEILRDALEISFWNSVGRVWAAGVIDLQQAKNFLEEAAKEKMVVEAFRIKLPAIDGRQSPFVRTMKKLHNTIEKGILNAPALQSELSDKEYKRLLRLAGAMKSITARYV